MNQASLHARIRRAISDKQWESAAAGLRELIALEPSVRAYLELSYVLSLLGNYCAASEATSAAASFPDVPREDLTDLLARLRTFNDAAGVRAIAHGLLHATVPAPQVLTVCALQLSNLNDHALALECAQVAVSQDPSGVAARQVRGQMLAQHGALDLAEVDFNWCIEREPGFCLAWWMLSRLRRQTTEANHVMELRRMLSNRGLDVVNAAFCAYALHKELDDLGDMEGAWQALEQGCKTKRATLDYSQSHSRELVNQLILSTVKYSVPEACEISPASIFIIGMHRSGTTLLEQMLDGHSQVHGAGELYDFTSAMRYQTDHHCQGVIDATIVERASAPGFDFGEVGKRYLDGLQWRLGGKPFMTDKLPSNFLNAGFICQALPQAKLLHMVRDPIEVCFSNLRELFSNANPYSYDQIELADFYLQYHRLMAHWREAYPGRILDIRYDRMVREPEAVMREVCDFCGLEFMPEMLAIGNRDRGVATASAVQVREGIQVREVPKWKPYEAHLQPLIRRLREGGVLD